MKHFLTLAHLSPADLTQILDKADQLKAKRRLLTALKGRSIAMIFSKSSTRTRVSFEVAVYELGGYAMYLDKNSLQLGRGEPILDTAMVLSRYVHGIVIRYHAHEDVETLAQHSSIPVINALTDRYHPCQIVADLQTIREKFGTLKAIRISYFGDGASNVARSLILGSKLAGCHLTIAAPEPYQPPVSFLNYADQLGPGIIEVTTSPEKAAKNAQVIYTDVWVSMGFEDEAQERIDLLTPYQVNSRLMNLADPHAVFMHCLPAYRGKEVTSEVIDGPQSIVYDQAENRLHVQKSILLYVFDLL